MRNKFFYAGYIVAATIFFLYYLFPAGDIRNYIVLKLNRLNPEYEVAIGRVAPAFPPGLNFYDVRIAYRNEPLISVERFKAVPGLLSMIEYGPNVSFKCSLFGGSIRGNVGIPTSKDDELSALATLDDLNITQIDMLKTWIPHDLSGILNGRFSFRRGGGQAVSAESTILLKDCGLEFAAPLYGIDKIGFDEINAKFEFNGNQLKIEQFEGRGEDLDGMISGSVIVRETIGRSILSLNGEAFPHAAFFNRLGKAAPITRFIKSQAGQRGIEFRIGGTPERPKFSLK